jgi:hypothetical protein
LLLEAASADGAIILGAVATGAADPPGLLYPNAGAEVTGLSTLGLLYPNVGADFGATLGAESGLLYPNDGLLGAVSLKDGADLLNELDDDGLLYDAASA